MKTPVLALRVSRRAIGAACLHDEELFALDGRYLRSRLELAVTAARRYLAQLLKQSQYGGVVLEAARHEGSTTTAIVGALLSDLETSAIPLRQIPIEDVLTAYGQPSLRSRRELRNLVESYWPQLAQMTGKVKPFVAEAAALALFAESRLALGEIVDP